MQHSFVSHMPYAHSLKVCLCFYWNRKNKYGTFHLFCNSVQKSFSFGAFRNLHFWIKDAQAVTGSRYNSHSTPSQEAQHGQVSHWGSWTWLGLISSEAGLTGSPRKQASWAVTRLVSLGHLRKSVPAALKRTGGKKEPGVSLSAVASPCVRYGGDSRLSLAKGAKKREHWIAQGGSGGEGRKGTDHTAGQLLCTLGDKDFSLDSSSGFFLWSEWII